MNVALATGPARRGLGGAPAAIRRAWASLGAAELRWAALLALGTTLLAVGQQFDDFAAYDSVAGLLRFAAADFADCALAVALGLLLWAVADRAPAGRTPRGVRLGLALLATVAAHAALGPAVRDLIEPLQPCHAPDCTAELRALPAWRVHLLISGQVLVVGALIFAWIELRRRNAAVAARLAAARQASAQLARSAIDARLAALQAQVDPQFLFDSLVDVEAAYGAGPARGADLLDRLNAYLRRALPRLQDDGSTIGNEVALVESWLALVAARRPARPCSRIAAEDCASAHCMPMILLPLLQWAAGPLDGPARAVETTIARAGGPAAPRIAVTLRWRGTPPNDAAGRTALQAIAERLRQRHGAGAGLDLATVAGTTRLVLHWPDEEHDGDRRRG